MDRLLGELNRLCVDLMHLHEAYLDLVKYQEAHPEALPPEIWSRLNKPQIWQSLANNIDWQMAQFPRTQEDRDRDRWWHVEDGLARGFKWVDDEVYKFASAALKHTTSKGSPGTMKASYLRYKKSLPPEKRRKTRRPHS
jgi:hypothetical protein